MQQATDVEENKRNQQPMADKFFFPTTRGKTAIAGNPRFTLGGEWDCDEGDAAHAPGHLPTTPAKVPLV